MPALRLSSVNLSDALKRAGGHSGFGAHGKYTRNLLVVVEVALAVILLSGAGLMIRTFANLRLLNPGFDTDRVLTLHVPLPEPKYSDSVEKNGVLRSGSRARESRSRSRGGWLYNLDASD